MVLSTILLISLFIWPMWKITLIAPQYPNGVTMYIWVNKITGDSPSTLQNINILNHYVGMKYIKPESIPELRYFPYVVYGMILIGLLAVFLDKWKMYLAWAVLMIVISSFGIYDFYLWEYDYGHSLSDTAPIKIPGASFQPPLIGRKEIINFTAISLPVASGYLVTAAILIAFIAAWLKRKMS